MAKKHKPAATAPPAAAPVKPESPDQVQPQNDESVKRQLAWRQQYAEREALIGSRLVIAELDDTERAFLATCQDLYRRWGGDRNPFENFIHSLIVTAKFGHSHTPDDVAHELEAFRENFDSMREDAIAFVRLYPSSMTEAEVK